MTPNQAHLTPNQAHFRQAGRWENTFVVLTSWGWSWGWGGHWTSMLELAGLCAHPRNGHRLSVCSQDVCVSLFYNQEKNFSFGRFSIIRTIWWPFSFDLLVYWGRDLLCSRDYPGTHYVSQVSHGMNTLVIAQNGNSPAAGISSAAQSCSHILKPHGS